MTGSVHSRVLEGERAVSSSRKPGLRVIVESQVPLTKELLAHKAQPRYTQDGLWASLGSSLASTMGQRCYWASSPVFSGRPSAPQGSSSSLGLESQSSPRNVSAEALPLQPWRAMPAQQY